MASVTNERALDCYHLFNMLSLTAVSSRESSMATLTIRNLPDEVHRALRVRAAQHGRSTEAEVREILALLVQSGGRVRLGTELRRFAEQIGGAELDTQRNAAPIKPASFD